jgi:hypothetical protein
VFIGKLKYCKPILPEREFGRAIARKSNKRKANGLIVKHQALEQASVCFEQGWNMDSGFH